MREIGEKLKKARLEKGLSLEDVQKKTKIHLNILKAIEGDGLTDLSPVYLRAFIKIYSKFLGFNPQEFVPEQKENPQAAHQQSEPAGKAPLRASNFKAPSINLKSIKPPKLLIKIFIFIVLAIIIMAGLSALGKFISSKRKAAVREANIVQPQPVETKKQRSKASSVSEKNQPALAQKEASGVRLAIIAKENCMVTLKVDGKIFFQGVLIKGRSESWRAKEKMELSLSNAGAVELIVNSQHFSNIGKRKQKINNILINKEGLHIGR
jgi:cytoskeletal protein RodZ